MIFKTHNATSTHTQGRIMHEFRQSHPRIWMVEGKKVKQSKKVPKINK